MSEADDSVERRMQPFGALSDDEWSVAARALRPLSLTSAQPLFHRGDGGDSMYLLVSGSVDVKSGVGDGDGPSIARRGPGAIIGELGLLAGEKRSATIVAAADTELWEIGREDFISAVGHREPWAIELLVFAARGMARRFAEIDRQLTTLIAETRADDRAPAGAKVAELEDLRRHLFTEWSF